MSEACRHTHLLLLTRRVETSVRSVGVQVSQTSKPRGAIREAPPHLRSKWKLRKIPGDFSWKSVRILKAEGLARSAGYRLRRPKSAGFSVLVLEISV